MDYVFTFSLAQSGPFAGQLFLGVFKTHAAARRARDLRMAGKGFESLPDVKRQRPVRDGERHEFGDHWEG